MTGLPIAVFLLATLLGGAACDPQQRGEAAGGDSTELAVREARLVEAIAQPDTGAAIARWLMPQELNEISGLALTADGRLLTHGDQRGQVFEIDYRRGMVVKQFSLGKPPAHDDFEAITVVGDTVILLASTGKLYMLHEGANDTRVEYTIHDTGLGRECEFEGLAFEPARHALLLACKVVRTKSLKDDLVIVRWNLGSGKRSQLTVPLTQVIASNGWSGFHPSDITINPFNGNYVIIAGREKALVEITPAGTVVLARLIPGEHAQPEGVVITPDSFLIVSDEWAPPPTKKKGGGSPGGTLGSAAITLYRWPLAGAPPRAP